MKTKKNVSKAKKRVGMRILMFGLGIIIILILAVVFLLPAFLSSESGRRAILAKINNSIEGKADYSALSMGWRKGVKVRDFSFEDDAGQMLVKVKQITARPQYSSILSGDINLGETVIDKPTIEIKLQDRPRQKTQRPQRQVQPMRKAQQPQQKVLVKDKRSQPAVLPINRIELVVNDGNVKISGGKAEPVELSKIKTRLELKPVGQLTNFDMNMTVAAEDKESRISVNGGITPGAKTGWSTQGVSGNLSVKVDDLDIGSLESILALAGIDVQA